MTVVAPTQAPAPTAETTTNVVNTDQANTTNVVAKPPEKDHFADKLELLSKKERHLWRERQSIEQEKQHLAQERAEYEKFKGLKAKAKQNPLDYLSEGGLSYDELTQFMLNGGKPTQEDELQAVRDEFKRFKEEQAKEKEDLKNQQTQAQAQAESQAIEDFKVDIGDYLEGNKELFEICHKQGDIGVNDILGVINLSYKTKFAEWHKGGRIGRPPGPMSIEAAAKIQEEFYEKEIIEFTKLNKLQSKLSPQPTDPQAPGVRPPSKTLTNNMASTAASVLPAKNDNDRMQRAMRALEGQKG